MNAKIKTCEDLLETMIESSGSDIEQFVIDPADHKLLYSFSRQIARGIAFTDRQHELFKTKIKDNYLSQINKFGIALSVIDQLRLPLRSIDRSRWIKLLELSGRQHIAVRFTFNKKLISHLEKIKKEIHTVSYDAGEKVHYFEFTEYNVFHIINTLKHAEFEIDKDLYEYYLMLQEIDQQRENHIPGVYSLNLKNLHSRSLDYIISDIGQPTRDNLALFKDRQFLYGLEHFDDTDLENSLNQLSPLAKKIATRNTNRIFISNKQYNLDSVLSALFELDRLPMMCILQYSQATEQLWELHSALKNIVPDESQSVLFRLDNDETGIEFNNFIRNNNLNNSVDTETKIVYVNNSKIPKPLFKKDWDPFCVLFLGSENIVAGQTTSYLNRCDLVIHYDDVVNPFMKSSRFNVQVIK